MIGFPPKYSEQIELTCSRQTAREANEHTLGLLNWSFHHFSQDSYLVELGWSWSSFGEKIIISMSDPSVLVIESKSSMPTTIIDWGKNKQNVISFLGLFEIRVIQDARSLKGVEEGFERDNDSRVDRLLDENKERELEKRGNR